MALPARETLSKKERICGKKDIDELLARGRFGNVPGIRYCIRTGTGLDINRIMVSVPKKFFKRAVLRNLLKRRIRESYRRQKGLLPDSGGTDVLFTYSTRSVMEYSDIFAAVGGILEKAASQSND